MANIFNEYYTSVAQNILQNKLQINSDKTIESEIMNILGPILFLIYIKNLELCVKYAKPTIFADNTSIFICGNNINAVQANVDTIVKQLL